MKKSAITPGTTQYIQILFTFSAYSMSNNEYILHVFGATLFMKYCIHYTRIIQACIWFIQAKFIFNIHTNLITRE